MTAWLGFAAFAAAAPAVTPDAASRAPAGAAPAPRAASAFAGKPGVGDSLLARQRGGTDAVSASSINGTVGDNQAVNVTTGGNLITGGAFAGAGGVPVVVQNSGNNVLIQSSVVVNVQLK